MEVTIGTPIPVQHLSSPTLTCSVNVSAIDVDVSISWTWTGPDTGAVTFPITGITPTAANKTVFVNTVMLSDLAVGSGNGGYTCIITIRSVQIAEFITDSEAGLDTISVDVRGMQLVHKINVNCSYEIVFLQHLCPPLHPVLLNRCFKRDKFP